MDLLDPKVVAHLDALVPPRPAELASMEAEAKAAGFPIIGPASGQLCYLVARLIGAVRVFELGSGFGYSTAWFARAVKENGGGKVFHVVWDNELSARARKHLTALGLDDAVEYRVGEAVKTLDETDGPFDLIFNDIDKAGYPASLSAIERKLRPGGVLIVDNLLWSGRIFDATDQSENTTGVRELTRLVFESPTWAASLIPTRDGVLVARKV